MDEDYDSGDIFITQSNFRTVTMQDAGEAADYFQGFDSLLDENCEVSTGEVVQYWDFSHETNNDTIPATAGSVDSAKQPDVHAASEVNIEPNVCAPDVVANVNVNVGQEPFVPLLPDL